MGRHRNHGWNYYMDARRRVVAELEREGCRPNLVDQMILLLGDYNRHHLTIYDLAEKSSIHRKVLLRLLAGETLPNTDTLSRLADALGLKLEWCDADELDAIPDAEGEKSELDKFLAGTQGKPRSIYEDQELLVIKRGEPDDE